MANYGYVLDVSAFQPNACYYNFWNSAKALGVRGGIVKLSEGTGWTNGYGASQIAAIKGTGLKVSGYHFSRFKGNSYQAVSEANLAISCAQRMGLPKGSPLVLDYEERLGYSSTNTQAAIAFLKCVKAAGYVPVFYSYSGMKNLWNCDAIFNATGAMTWIAAYPLGEAAVTNPLMNYFPGISNHICAWQYTDNFAGWHVDGSIDLTGVFTTMVDVKKTEGGNLDGFSFNGSKLTVNGWFASDKAKGKDNHFVIITDEQGHELGRQKVDLSARPDVAKALPDIPGGGQSGFSASFDYTIAMSGKKLRVYFRYTDDLAGNGNATDFTSVIALDKSVAYTDGKSVTTDGKLVVNGWFASDLAIGKKYRYLILYDVANKRELQRVKIDSIKRDDVAKANVNVYGADQAGFSAAFNYNANLVGRKLQIIARYSDDAGGEGKYVDYWFDPFAGPTMFTLDGKTEQSFVAHDVRVQMQKDGTALVTAK